MNKRGLTLVELVAVLVILSIIAVIVTPTINGNIRDYKEQMYTNQLEAIKDSAVNFSADNASEDYFPKTDKQALKITLSELQQDGYIDENIKNPKDGGYFDPNETFVLVTCEIMKDEQLQYKDNYKYTYKTYLSIDDYIKSEAIRYAKEKNITSTTTISSSSLNIYKTLKTTNNSVTETVSFKSVELTVSHTKEGYEYIAKVNK